MACGLFRLRFYGPVVLVTPHQSLTRIQVQGALVRPDLRRVMQADNIPEWLLHAAKHNYHDGAVLAKLASAMQAREDDNDEDDDDDSNSDSSSSVHSAKDLTEQAAMLATKVPLCLHCRRPASELCPGCEGVYFCPAPRTCRQDG